MKERTKSFFIFSLPFSLFEVRRYVKRLEEEKRKKNEWVSKENGIEMEKEPVHSPEMMVKSIPPKVTIGDLKEDDNEHSSSFDSLLAQELTYILGKQNPQKEKKMEKDPSTVTLF
jgi:hypothetical protein